MNTSPLTFFRYQDTDKKDWDDFVMNQAQGSIHQITAWRNFQLTIPGRDQVLGFGLKDAQGQIIATTWCVQMHTGVTNKFWFYSARGPVFASDDKAITNYFLKKVKDALAETGALFWRLDPYFHDKDWNAVTELKHQAATKNFQPTDSLLLSLKLTEEELLAQMKRTGRRNLKLAQKANLEIKKYTAQTLTEEAVNAFYSLNTETTTRDKFHGHEKEYYCNFITKLDPLAVLYLVESQGKTIAAAITTFCGTKAIYYFGASTSDPEYRDLRAPYLLQWEMIKEAKTKGCKTYDFTGITPENQPNHPYKGITQFKTRFGGYRSTYAAGREIVLKPLWYTIYKAAKALKA